MASSPNMCRLELPAALHEALKGEAQRQGMAVNRFAAWLLFEHPTLSEPEPESVEADGDVLADAIAALQGRCEHHWESGSGSELRCVLCTYTLQSYSRRSTLHPRIDRPRKKARTVIRHGRAFA